MRSSQPAIAFLPIDDLRIPHNNREQFLARELERQGWRVVWLRPRSGRNDGVEVRGTIVEFPMLDVRGRRFLLPAYLAARLRLEGVRLVWLSGWRIRDVAELDAFVRTMRLAGIRVVYDPIDPICEILYAQGDLDETAYRACIAHVGVVYARCALVTAVTPQLRDLLVARGARAERTVVARWGTDAALFDRERVVCDLKARLGLLDQTFLVGWLGTMESFKGLHEIIMPLVESVSRSGSDIRFVIAGRGTHEDDVRAWARNNPRLNVSVLPSIPYAEAPSFTGSLDAYLVPTNPSTSYARSICPVKCFDALAMGTPSIVTRTAATEFLGDFPELVSLVDFDVPSFERALMERYRARAAGGGRAAPVRRYSHQDVSRELAATLRTVIA